MHHLCLEFKVVDKYGEDWPFIKTWQRTVLVNIVFTLSNVCRSTCRQIRCLCLTETESSCVYGRTTKQIFAQWKAEHLILRIEDELIRTQFTHMRWHTSFTTNTRQCVHCIVTPNPQSRQFLIHSKQDDHNDLVRWHRYVMVVWICVHGFKESWNWVMPSMITGLFHRWVLGGMTFALPWCEAKL